MNPKQNKSVSFGDIWRDFIAAEQKSNSKLGKLFTNAIYGSYENRVLTLFFGDDASIKAAKGQSEPLKNKLKPRLLCDRIDFRIGSDTAVPPQTNQLGRNRNQSINIGNPLQALIFTDFGRDRNDKELTQPVLQAAVKAEKKCDDLYNKLNQRTLEIAGGEHNTIKISFNWRMRVGGTRGFCELLLPVLHPVFGIPYIPASSLKGAAKAWVKKHQEDNPEIAELLGMLDGKLAKCAKVEILDAFPTKPCLSVDVSTPQWHWREENQKVIYSPEPHPLLSLEQPQILIGLRATSPKYADKVQVVKEWLENALKTGGIGSRISGGYGRTINQEPQFSDSESFDFELFTQGMYGSLPINKSQGTVEFRPTAIRGIIRYWFRAVALAIYDPHNCLTLEELLFGKLGQQGVISLSTRINPSVKKDPYFYSGKIILEAKEKQYLLLVEQLLILASHLGGLGRGSRRPLHLLDRRMRGCHFAINSNDFPLADNSEQWKALFKNVQASNQNFISTPGEPNNRQQDVLDRNAQVWLLKTPDLVNPDKVKDWQTEGSLPNVRGAALNLLYSDIRFKGVSQGQGNANVGGALKTPSFVWIKSIFPYQSSAYQVVTIFGVNHPDRLEFAKELKRQGAILVYGEMPTEGQPSRPNRHIPNPKKR